MTSSRTTPAHHAVGSGILQIAERDIGQASDLDRLRHLRLSDDDRDDYTPREAYPQYSSDASDPQDSPQCSRHKAADGYHSGDSVHAVGPAGSVYDGGHYDDDDYDDGVHDYAPGKMYPDYSSDASDPQDSPQCSTHEAADGYHSRDSVHAVGPTGSVYDGGYHDDNDYDDGVHDYAPGEMYPEYSSDVSDPQDSPQCSTPEAADGYNSGQDRAVSVPAVSPAASV